MTSKLLLAAVLLSPAIASAQFTTVVTAPKKEAPAPAVVRAEAARQDSATRMAMADMKVWVDSAAASIGAATAAAMDTTAPAPATTEQAAGGDVEPQASTTAFRNGVPAPNTASALPLLGVIAFGAMGMGAALLWRKRA